MDLEDFRKYCLTKSNVSEGTPFGPDVLVFKVDGKVFALASLDDVPPQVNLKCDPERALDLRDRYEEVRPGYHMNKRHWNTIELSDRIPPAELREWIDHSYELVAARLTKERPRRPLVRSAPVEQKQTEEPPPRQIAKPAADRSRQSPTAKPARRPRGKRRASR